MIPSRASVGWPRSSLPGRECGRRHAPRTSSRLREVLGIAVLLLPLVACTRLEKYSTSGSEAYCGSMVSTPGFHRGFIRAGSPPQFGMSLTLEIEHLTTLPGTLTTDDRENGLCADQALPLFAGARLRAIEEAFHDPLSTLDFGQGHEHDFHAWVDSNCAGTLLTIVSLMKDDAVEVRLLKPAPEPNADTPDHERPGFALFHLNRQAAGCGF